MKIAVQTSLPAFQNDIGDVVRLFYGEGAAVEETQQADARLTHIHEEADGEWRETFVLTDCSGRTEQNTLSAPAVFGGLEEKRQKKRLIKRCCYMLLKRLSGRQPAWGSLTGIRPTRLYYQQLKTEKRAARPDIRCKTCLICRRKRLICSMKFSTHSRGRCIYRHSFLHDALRVLLVLIRRNRRRAIGRAVPGGATA